MGSTKVWTLIFDTKFDKQFNRLSQVNKERIMDFLENRVLKHHNPKTLAKQLTGNLSGYWSFRVGDYRIIADIEEDAFTILAIEVGHRRDVYY